MPGYFGATERHTKHESLSFVAQGAKKEGKSEQVGGGLLALWGQKLLGQRYRGNTVGKSIDQVHLLSDQENCG